MTLELAHSPADGTLLHGTSRGDGSADVLRARHGGLAWRWSRNLGAWYVPRSRDTRPRPAALEQVAAALRAAGFDVELDVDDSTRPTADVVSDRRERAADRADALDAKAERHAGASKAAFAAEHEILDAIPPGQPILVGHHSERRHRRALDRAHSLMERGSEHAEIAADAERRAGIARVAAAGRESRTTITNRIDKLGAEIAVELRALYGYWRRWGETQTWVVDETTGREVLRAIPVDPDSDRGVELVRRIVDATEARLYWRDVLDAMGPLPVRRELVRKGDLVRYRGTWYPVVRVNAKSATIGGWLGVESMTWTARYDELGAIRAPGWTDVGETTRPSGGVVRTYDHESGARVWDRTRDVADDEVGEPAGELGYVAARADGTRDDHATLSAAMLWALERT